MEKYYDYAQEKYVEGDPILSACAQMAGLQLMVKNAHEHAKRREEERAKQAEADHTKDYKISSYGELYYIKKFIKDSFKKAETWNDRLRLYNELFVDYLKRKSYQLNLYNRPEIYALSLKEFKEIVKYEQSLEAK